MREDHVDVGGRRLIMLTRELADPQRRLRESPMGDSGRTGGMSVAVVRLERWLRARGYDDTTDRVV